jgi:hypothetical protein
VHFLCAGGSVLNVRETMSKNDTLVFHESHVKKYLRFSFGSPSYCHVYYTFIDSVLFLSNRIDSRCEWQLQFVHRLHKSSDSCNPCNVDYRDPNNSLPTKKPAE